MVGQRLGHFRILEEIGSGGMGVVYRASDEQLGREVAIKVLKQGIVSDDSARRHFRKEASNLSRLNHSNIETVYEFSTENGIDFLVMEFLPGKALNRKLAEGALPEEEILKLGTQLCDGLSAAHDQRILHRDLKPANIFVTADDRLKILDFGLAKLVPVSVELQSTQSSSGHASNAGTLPYMAPEQLREEKLDPRTDVYAAGAVLYEMATTRRPFMELQTPRLIDAILHRAPVPPSIVNPKISPGLQNTILKALRKDPARRQQSARELREELQNLNAPGSWSPYAAAAGLLVFLAFLGLMIWQFRQPIRDWISPFPKTRHIVILPFTNVGGDPVNQAFCDGLVETLASKLTQLEQFHGTLLVVPTSEVRRERVMSVREAQKTFGVNLVISGSVQRDKTGDVHLTANLIDAKSLRQLQAVTMDTDIESAFLPAGLVDQVVEMLRLQVVPDARNFLAAGGTNIGKAYDFYLQGEGFLQQYEKSENLDNAIGSFRKAVGLDSRFALGHAGLAKAYWLKFVLTKDPQWVELAQTSCSLAAELNDKLSEVHVTLGIIKKGTGRYQEAIGDFERALKIDPANFEAHIGLAQACRSLGLLKKAETTYKHAIELQRSNWRAYMELGYFYNHSGRYQEAIATFRRVIELVPDSFQGYSALGGVYLYIGRYPDAISVLEKSISIRPNARAYWNLGYANFMLRKFPEAASTYEMAIELRKEEQHYSIWGNLGDAYDWSDRRDKAKAAYERAIELAKQELEINPRNAEALVSLAWYYAKLDNKKESLQSLDQAIAFNQPDDPEFPFFAALVYNHFQETGVALDWIERAVKQGYPKAEIRNRIELDNLKSNPEFTSLISD